MLFATIFPLLGNVPDFEQHVALYHDLPTKLPKQPIALARCTQIYLFWCIRVKRVINRTTLRRIACGANFWGSTLDDETLAELNPNFLDKEIIISRPIKLPY